MDELVHITKSRLGELEEREKNYREDIYCRMSTKPHVIVVRTEYERLVEKAKKYDHNRKEYNELTHKEYEELREKAKKWDSLGGDGKYDVLIPNKAYNEMKEKAEKCDAFDEWQTSDSSTAFNAYRKLEKIKQILDQR